MIDLYAIIVLVFNAFANILTAQYGKIGRMRSGIIGGWMASFLGLWFLLDHGKLIIAGVDKYTFLGVYGFFMAFCVLLLYVMKSPSLYVKMNPFNKFLYYLPRAGIFMGVIAAIVNQILG